MQWDKSSHIFAQQITMGQQAVSEHRSQRKDCWDAMIMYLPWDYFHCKLRKSYLGTWSCTLHPCKLINLLTFSLSAAVTPAIELHSHLSQRCTGSLHGKPLGLVNAARFFSHVLLGGQRTVNSYLNQKSHCMGNMDSHTEQWNSEQWRSRKIYRNGTFIKTSAHCEKFQLTVNNFIKTSAHCEHGWFPVDHCVSGAACLGAFFHPPLRSVGLQHLESWLFTLSLTVPRLSKNREQRTGDSEDCQTLASWSHSNPIRKQATQGLVSALSFCSRLPPNLQQSMKSFSFLTLRHRFHWTLAADASWSSSSLARKKLCCRGRAGSEPIRQRLHASSHVHTSCIIEECLLEILHCKFQHKNNIKPIKPWPVTGLAWHPPCSHHSPRHHVPFGTSEDWSTCESSMALW